MRVSKISSLAEGEECAVRIPQICNFDPATAVLAHYSLAGLSGRGIKSPDFIAAFCCSACHDYIDFRKKSANFNRDEIRLMHAEGCFRTQYRLMQLGKLK